MFQRLDAQPELLGPARHHALGSNYRRRRWRSWGRYVDPTSLLRLGKARLPRFLDGPTAHALAEQCTPQAALATLDDHLDTLFGARTDPHRDGDRE